MQQSPAVWMISRVRGRVMFNRAPPSWSPSHHKRLAGLKAREQSRLQESRVEGGNHINLENRSPSHRGSPLPPVSALDSQGGCGESQDNDAQTVHSPPACRESGDTKAKLNGAYSSPDLSSHMSQRSCTNSAPS